MSGTALSPTWQGHVATTRDALILFEACLQGILHHVPRRPHDRERSQLIKSGMVFIYEENASGIKRWTDGVPWSPSRILGNFLVYRELIKPFPPGEKKRATKRNKRPSRPGEPYPRPGEAPVSPTTPGAKSDTNCEGREEERRLIGSLIDSYGFKEDGLVKKTMSVNVNGIHHHLVSYYKIDHVLSGDLKPVSADARLGPLEIRHELLYRQSFRTPVDGEEDRPQETVEDQHQQGIYNGFAPPGYDPRTQYANPHAHHTGSMDIGFYQHGTYSTAPPMQSGMNSYGPPPTLGPQGFLPMNHPIQHSQAPPFTQSSFTPQYTTHGIQMPMTQDRSPSQPQQPEGYPAYRHHLSSIASRPVDPNSIHDQNSRDNSSWSRAGSVTGVYAPTAVSNGMNQGPSYSFSHAPQLSMAPVSLPMRNPDIPWSGHQSDWPAHSSPLATRQPSFTTQHN